MKEQIRNHISDRTIANPSSVIEFCRAQDVKMVDFRFTDLLGASQHFSSPVTELDESMFVEGVGFDGSSIRGFQHINESDMILLPDAGGAAGDPPLRGQTPLLTRR